MKQERESLGKIRRLSTHLKPSRSPTRTPFASFPFGYRHSRPAPSIPPDTVLPAPLGTVIPAPPGTVISGTAFWFQQSNRIYLSENWGEIFRIPVTKILLLEDYLVLIEDERDRNRIWKAHESLISGPPGFEWRDEFTLRGRKVETFAVVALGCVFGLDRPAR